MERTMILRFYREEHGNLSQILTRLLRCGIPEISDVYSVRNAIQGRRRICDVLNTDHQMLVVFIYLKFKST